MLECYPQKLLPSLGISNKYLKPPLRDKLMASNLTFKEYVNSKDQLRSAITNTPQRIAEYEVRTYCKLPVGDTKEEKEHVNLRPKHKIIVEWLYEDVDNPTPLNLRFEGPVDSDPLEEHAALWKGERLLKWLLRNTHENT